MHLIYPILTRSNQLNYVVNNNSSSCSIIFYLKWGQYFTVSEKWLGLINRWKKNIFKKRIKGQLLNADCSITQRTFAHKSFFQRSAAQQAFTNKRISNTIWNPVLASTVQICLLICRRAQKQYSCVLLCKCQPYGSANSVLYKPFVSLFLPAISVASLVQTNVVLVQGTAEWVWMHWHTSEFTSWTVLISNN